MYVVPLKKTVCIIVYKDDNDDNSYHHIMGPYLLM